MFITKKHIPRRAFLRGVMGTAIGLPLLDAMVPALTAQEKTAAKPQLRFGAVYAPHGSIPGYWRPVATGTDFEFTHAIDPFSRFRDQVVISSGMSRKEPGAHLIANTMWLNATKPQAFEASDVREDTTIDQRIVELIGQNTPLPSLELTMEDMSQASGACDNGYSCIYMSTISWRTPTTPLPMEINPYLVFERLFGDVANREERLQKLQDNASILDSVTAEASKMKGVLGARDRTRLDSYLENIREVERRIQNALSRSNGADDLKVPDAPPGVPDSYDEHAKLLFDLQAIAYQGDLTRVFTFMLALEGSDINYPAAGIAEGDHTLSHHGNDPVRMAKRLDVNHYHASLMAGFMDKLKATQDGDGTLLDHTVLLYGSGMGEGNEHARTNLPLMVMGGKSFGIRGGRHLAHPDDTPMANLLVSVAQKCGVQVEKIGNSNGTVDI